MRPLTIRAPLRHRGRAVPRQRGLPLRIPSLRARNPGVNSVGRVLAISPHLDDAALSVGATLADFSARGADLEVLTLFAGVPREPSPKARGYASTTKPSSTHHPSTKTSFTRSPARFNAPSSPQIHRPQTDRSRRPPRRHQQRVTDLAVGRPSLPIGRPPATAPRLTRPARPEAWEQKTARHRLLPQPSSHALARGTPTGPPNSSRTQKIRGGGRPTELLFPP
jgi:hypothetical protein